MKRARGAIKELFSFSLRDLIISIVILAAAVCCCLLLRVFEHTDAFASMLFILAVFLIARFTSGYLFGIMSSIVGVLAVNYMFTYPYFNFNFTITGYPLTIACMLAVSIVTSALTTQAKRQESLKVEIEREKTRANLLRAISHDLRTPLTVILGANGAVLENDNLTEEQRKKLLTEVNEEAEWLIRVVENLLTVTRMDNTEAASINKEPEIAEEVLAAAVQKFKIRFPENRVSVTVPSEPLMVPMDAVLIVQVICNLLENAALHAEGSDETVLSVHRRGKFAAFEVADRGPGIQSDRLSGILSGTYAGDREHTPGKQRGMGIGLSVCRSIVCAHGGEMTIENRRGGGVLVRFTIPLEDANDE